MASWAFAYDDGMAEGLPLRAGSSLSSERQRRARAGWPAREEERERVSVCVFGGGGRSRRMKLSFDCGHFGASKIVLAQSSWQ